MSLISFIVDGFDPWNRVSSLLDAIHDAVDDIHCEVLLMASFLLETPLRKCRQKGEALFGASFRLIPNDSVSIFHARLRAQELANGEKFFYLSPAIRLDSEVIKILLSHLGANMAPVSPKLSFKYDADSPERVLAHGWAISGDGKSAPILMGARLDAPQCLCDYPTAFPNPYCFCSSHPYYEEDDKKGNFLRNHIFAGVRSKLFGKSLGSCRVTMHVDAFPIYYRSIKQAEIPSVFIPKVPEELFALGIEADAYGDLFIGKSARELRMPDMAAEDEIFWGLACTQRPEYAAAATRRHSGDSLLKLCRQSLHNISGCEWRHAAKRALRNLSQQGAGWQSCEAWLDKYANAQNLYASPQPSLWSAFLKSPHKGIALRNLFYTISCGLLWGEKNG